MSYIGVQPEQSSEEEVDLISSLYFLRNSAVDEVIVKESDNFINKRITEIETYNNNNWDTAYSWGNHSGLYLKLDASNDPLTGDLSFSTDNGIFLNTDLPTLTAVPLINLKFNDDEAKAIIAYIDENDTEVIWLQAHNKLNGSDVGHKHFSIEASDNAGLKQTRLSVGYGADTVNVNVNQANFQVSGEDGIKTIDSDFDGILKLTPYTTFDIYPQAQASRALRVNDDGSNIILSVLGLSELQIGESNLTLTGSSGSNSTVRISAPDQYDSIVEFWNSGNNAQQAKIQYDESAKDLFITNSITGSNSDMVFSSGTNGETIRIKGSGNVGIDTNSPTARLHLPAGTATAGTAPLKFTSGVLLTTPESGALNFVDDKFYVTCVGTQRVIDRTSDVKLDTTTVTNTTTETTVYTGLVPANSLRAGNILKLNMSGTIDEAAAFDAVTIRVKIGGVTIATIVSPASGIAAKCWHISGFATLRSVGASGSMAWHMDMNADTVSSDACGLNTVNTTTAENVTVTAQWNTEKAGNIFTCTQGFMEYKN
jgi:hypothetical protein